MEELIEKVEALKEELNENVSVKKIKELNEKLEKDKELLKNIEKYQYTKDINLKNKIMNNNLFKEYKEEETEINFIILEINKRLKQINIKIKQMKGLFMEK